MLELEENLDPQALSRGQYFFFFQAEDGIRDYKVTGVQTCALPILLMPMILSFENAEPDYAVIDFRQRLVEPFIGAFAYHLRHVDLRKMRIFNIKIGEDRKSTRLNSSHLVISYAVFCLKKKKKTIYIMFEQSSLTENQQELEQIRRLIQERTIRQCSAVEVTICVSECVQLAHEQCADAM